MPILGIATLFFYDYLTHIIYSKLVNCFSFILMNKNISQ